MDGSILILVILVSASLLTLNWGYIPMLMPRCLKAMKITKQEIADYYGISKKTLAKWIQLIPNILDYETYRQARSLSWFNFFEIRDQLGAIEYQKPLFKSTIKNICKTGYRTLRENISEMYCGITREVYVQLNVFPPFISKKIIDHLGV